MTDISTDNSNGFASEFNDDLNVSTEAEIALWKAVIMQILTDLASGSKKSEARTAKREAMKWIFDDSEDFNTVCINADLEPEYVRSKARAMIAKRNIILPVEPLRAATRPTLSVLGKTRRTPCEIKYTATPYSHHVFPVYITPQAVMGLDCLTK